VSDTPDELLAQDPSGPDAAVQESEDAVEEDLALAAIAHERDEYLDSLKRLQADFENYKKRIIRQQTEHLERAAEALVEKLLPVLDTFDHALAHGEGFDQVLASLMGVLEKEGLERIQPDGAAFDPNEHDAVAHEPRDDAGSGAEVIEVMRPGYRWKGRVVRPAMVKVKG
jgi:molecular chaperone GrpE